MAEVRTQDIEDLCTQAELVTFLPVPSTLTPGHDVTVWYRCGRGFTVTSLDWVGVFSCEWRRDSEPHAFQWAKFSKVDKVKGQRGLKAVTFPAHTFKLLSESGSDTFQYLYVSKSGELRGQSSKFTVTSNRSAVKDVTSHTKENSTKKTNITLERPSPQPSPPSTSASWDMGADSPSTSDLSSDIVVLSTSPSQDLLVDSTQPLPDQILSEGFVITTLDDLDLEYELDTAKYFQQSPHCTDDEKSLKNKNNDISKKSASTYIEKREPNRDVVDLRTPVLQRKMQPPILNRLHFVGKDDTIVGRGEQSQKSVEILKNKNLIEEISSSDDIDKPQHSKCDKENLNLVIQNICPDRLMPKLMKKRKRQKNKQNTKMPAADTSSVKEMDISLQPVVANRKRHRNDKVDTACDGPILPQSEQSSKSSDDEAPTSQRPANRNKDTILGITVINDRDTNQTEMPIPIGRGKCAQCKIFNSPTVEDSPVGGAAKTKMVSSNRHKEEYVLRNPEDDHTSTSTSQTEEEIVDKQPTAPSEVTLAHKEAPTPRQRSRSKSPRSKSPRSKSPRSKSPSSCRSRVGSKKSPSDISRGPVLTFDWKFETTSATRSEVDTTPRLVEVTSQDSISGSKLSQSDLDDRSRDGFPSLPGHVGHVAPPGGAMTSQGVGGAYVVSAWNLTSAVAKKDGRQNNKSLKEAEPKEDQTSGIPRPGYPPLASELVTLMQSLPPAHADTDGVSLVDWQRGLVPHLHKRSLPHFKAKYKSKKTSKCHNKSPGKLSMTSTQIYKAMSVYKKGTSTVYRVCGPSPGVSPTSTPVNSVASPLTTPAHSSTPSLEVIDTKAAERQTSTPVLSWCPPRNGMSSTREVMSSSKEDMESSKDDTSEIEDKRGEESREEAEPVTESPLSPSLSVSGGRVRDYIKRYNKLVSARAEVRRRRLISQARDLKMAAQTDDVITFGSDATDTPTGCPGFDFSTAASIEEFRSRPSDLMFTLPNNTQIMTSSNEKTAQTIDQSGEADDIADPSRDRMLSQQEVTSEEQSENEVEALTQMIGNTADIEARLQKNKNKIEKLERKRLKMAAMVNSLNSELRRTRELAVARDGVVYTLQRALQVEISRLQQLHDDDVTLTTMGVPLWKPGTVDLWGNPVSRTSTHDVSPWSFGFPLRHESHVLICRATHPACPTSVHNYRHSISDFHPMPCTTTPPTPCTPCTPAHNVVTSTTGTSPMFTTSTMGHTTATTRSSRPPVTTCVVNPVSPMHSDAQNHQLFRVPNLHQPVDLSRHQSVDTLGYSEPESIPTRRAEPTQSTPTYTSSCVTAHPRVHSTPMYTHVPHLHFHDEQLGCSQAPELDQLTSRVAGNVRDMPCSNSSPTFFQHFDVQPEEDFNEIRLLIQNINFMLISADEMEKLALLGEIALDVILGGIFIYSMGRLRLRQKTRPHLALWTDNDRVFWENQALGVMAGGGGGGEGFKQTDCVNKGQITNEEMYIVFN